MYDLKDKTVFITGGAQGLGKAYCEAVLERGAKVFFVDVDRERGETTAKNLKASFKDDNVQFHPLDVTKAEDFTEVFNKAVTHYGHIDVMVNNAGILNEGNWERMIQINFFAPVKGTKLAIEHMRTDKGGRGGRIINISSLAGLADHFGLPVYCGTKHAVRSFTSSVASHPTLASDTGVQLACLHPDAVNTDLFQKVQEESSRICAFDIVKEHMGTNLIPMSRVVEAFLKLIQLDEMNGALLMVRKDAIEFQKMSMTSLGEVWPVVDEQPN